MRRLVRLGGRRRCEPRSGLWLVAALCLMLGSPANAAAPGPSAEADAVSIESCLSDAATATRDPRQCGERIVRECLSAGDVANPPPSAQLACEKRRTDAWNLVARRAYRQFQAKLGDADKRLLRISQAQFELELRDLCATARALAGDDGDLAVASCASDLVASRALILTKLAAGRGVPAR